MLERLQAFIRKTQYPSWMCVRRTRLDVAVNARRSGAHRDIQRATPAPIERTAQERIVAKSGCGQRIDTGASGGRAGTWNPEHCDKPDIGVVSGAASDITHARDAENAPGH